MGYSFFPIAITGDRNSHRVLGAQIMGHVSSEVSKRVDVMATAIFNKLKMEDLSDINFSYTPPLSSPWDPVQIASQAWCKNIHRNFQRLSALNLF
jgi:hypothetical protein